MAAIRMNRTHRVLVAVVVTGAVVIAAIGFAGSYAAVRELALRKGFGWFANVFPIGIDAGIVVLLALDLLLTWLRIPFPLLRQTAWLLTAATIAFNGAAAWPDPLGVGMHGIIPILFVVSVEAARHAIGRVADITADRHMESVRIARWLLAPVPTFRLWRRMKLWELRSYDEVIRLEQERLVYQARLRARYGRSWRRKAPIEALMPLRLARYGVPLAETVPAGLEVLRGPAAAAPPAIEADPAPAPTHASAPVPAPAPGPEAVPAPEPAAPASASTPVPVPSAEAGAPRVTVPTGNGVTVPTGNGGRRALANGNGYFPAPRVEYVPEPEYRPEPEPEPEPVPEPDLELGPPAPGPQPVDNSREEIYARAFRAYVGQFGEQPNARQFGLMLLDRYGIQSPNGGPLSESTLRPFLRELKREHVP